MLVSKKKTLVLTVALTAAVVAVLGGLAWWLDFGARGKLTLNFFNVGQGDAALIRMPDGADVLIDGGPDRTVLAKLGQTLPFYDRTIEMVILTHPHADHLAGLLPVLERYKVERVVTTGVVHPSGLFERWNALLKDQMLPVTIARPGSVYHFGAATLEIVAPVDDWNVRRVGADKIGEGGGLNDTSIVTRVCLTGSCALLVGDATSAVEEQLLASRAPLRADVLKVGHHGSKYSTTEAFVKAVRPVMAVISVGKNHYGHPSGRVIALLERLGARVFRTDRDGNVVLITDGKSWRVKR